MFFYSLVAEKTSRGGKGVAEGEESRQKAAVFSSGVTFFLAWGDIC